MVDLKTELWAGLRGGRAAMLARLDGLTEYDQRRPMTPTGTNLLGLLKHLAGEEYGYLGECFGRPPVERPTWFREDPHTEIDMWATADESTEYIVSVYCKACAHADATIRDLELNSPGRVAHWGDQETTLGELMIRMVSETAAHGGQADIVRELIDGRIQAPNVVLPDASAVSAGTEFWRNRRAEIQAVAEGFR